MTATESPELIEEENGSWFMFWLNVMLAVLVIHFMCCKKPNDPRPTDRPAGGGRKTPKHPPTKIPKPRPVLGMPEEDVDLRQTLQPVKPKDE